MKMNTGANALHSHTHTLYKKGRLDYWMAPNELDGPKTEPLFLRRPINRLLFKESDIYLFWEFPLLLLFQKHTFNHVRHQSGSSLYISASLLKNVSSIISKNLFPSLSTFNYFYTASGVTSCKVILVWYSIYQFCTKRNFWTTVRYVSSLFFPQSLSPTKLMVTYWSLSKRKHG